MGVNHLAVDEPRREIDIFRLDDATEKRQIERLAGAARRARRQRRSRPRWTRVRAAAAGTDNLVPPILAAVRANATHGEICDAMRDVFGVHHPDSQTSGV